MVTIKSDEFSCECSHLDRIDNYDGWTIKYYCPNGGILALDISDNQGNYFSIATDHIDPCVGVNHFFVYAKEVIDEMA